MNIVLAELPIASERFDATEHDDGVLAMMRSEWSADLELLWQSGVSYFDDGIEACTIEELEDGYNVTVPIPVTIERVDDKTYQATFEEANIAITGFDGQDAYQSLVAEILDTYDTLVNEPELGRDAAAQLAVLRRHIVQA